MNTMNRLMKKCVVAALVLLAQGSLFAEEVKSTLPPLPGSEYTTKDANGKIQKRKWRDVKVADLVEGSPEWVVRQIYVLERKRNFDELAKYVSPKEFSDITGQQPEALAALVESVNIDTVIVVGDNKIEADRAYMYIKLQDASGGSWYGAYRYFLKRDGKWIRVSSSEWQQGKCK